MNTDLPFKKWGLPIFLFSACVNIALSVYVIKRHYSFVKNPIITTYNERMSHFLKFPIDSNDVVFAGDSETQNFKIEEYLDNYFPIKNRGINGDISEGLLRRANEIIIHHPKKLFLEIGLNDLFYKIKQQKTIDNIDSIVKLSIRISPRTKIYINNIFPTSGFKNGYCPKKLIPNFNNRLKLYCTSHSITLIDINSHLSNNNDLKKEYDCGDGIHLNDNGYKVWASVLKPYLKE